MTASEDSAGSATSSSSGVGCGAEGERTVSYHMDLRLYEELMLLALPLWWIGLPSVTPSSMRVWPTSRASDVEGIP